MWGNLFQRKRKLMDISWTTYSSRENTVAADRSGGLTLSVDHTQPQGSLVSVDHTRPQEVLASGDAFTYDTLSRVYYGFLSPEYATGITQSAPTPYCDQKKPSKAERRAFFRTWRESRKQA